MIRLLLLPIIIAFLLSFDPASSFIHISKVPSPANHHITLTNNHRPTQKLASTQTEQETKQSGSTTTVRFYGIQKFSTDPIVLPNSDKCIIEFFKEHRNLLLSEKDNVEVVSSPSKIDMDKWKSKMDSNSDGDLGKDEVVQVQTMMQFPGLRAIAASVLGTRLVTSDDDSTFPEYQFTLLNSYNKAEGLPPAVWMYNLLTGNSKKEASSDNNMTSSFTTVKLERINDSEYIFTSNAQLEVNINFPSTLLKLIPLSTDTLEERGSSAIQKALEKQVGSNLERFRSAYIKWLEV